MKIRSAAPKKHHNFAEGLNVGFELDFEVNLEVSWFKICSTTVFEFLVNFWFLI